MDARNFESRKEPARQTRRTAHAYAITLVAAAALIVLYATGILRIGPKNGEHAVDVDVSVQTTDAPARRAALAAPANGG